MSDLDTWMPLYIGDYLKDTPHLDATESGAYLHLIMHYWVQKGVVTYDIKRLLKICKLSGRNSHETLATVVEFFTLKDGFLIHKRIDGELLEALKNQGKQKGRTAAATAARWGKKDDSTDDLKESVTDNVTLTPSPSPSPFTKTINNAGTSARNSIIQLEQLTVDNIADWLMQQQVAANPIMVDIRQELEKFKVHFLAYDGKDKHGNAVSNWVAKFGSWLLEANKQAKYGVKNEKIIGSNGQVRSGQSGIQPLPAGTKRERSEQATAAIIAKRTAEWEARQQQVDVTPSDSGLLGFSE